MQARWRVLAGHAARAALVVTLLSVLPSARALAERAARDLPPPRMRVIDPGTPIAVAPTAGAHRSDASTSPLDRLPARPSVPPPRPAERTEPDPEDLVFEVERPGGTIKAYPDGEGRAVFVMLGNPHIQGFEHTRDGKTVDALEIKANLMVAWIDTERFDVFQGFQRLGGRGVGKRKPGPLLEADGSPRSEASVLQEAVLGIYAEGAVELRYGDLVFRADVLHLEPRTYQALLVEPRFDGRAAGNDVAGGALPLHVRARSARLVAKGVAVFDQAEVSASRADDRFALQVQRLTVRELAEETDGGPAEDRAGLLGFRSLSAQRYRAQQTRLRGERLPLLYWPEAEFGIPSGEAFPVHFRGIDTGSRSSLGYYGFVGVGSVLGSPENPILEWTLTAGAYLERGPAAGLDLDWDRPRSRGALETWGVADFDGQDRIGYEEGTVFRWKVNLENRAPLTKRLLLDTEFNAFSDRGMNLEFFETDALQHKDRESYLRLRHEIGPMITTLTGKWHQRDYVTETLEVPELAVWLTSVPLFVPRRRGGPSVDLTSVSRAGWLSRRFDEALTGEATYDALRMATDTRVHLSFDVGDVRVTSYAGLDADAYLERDDGGDDLLRTALLAGARANLQLHRTWDLRSVPLELQRVRHIVDLDIEAVGRFEDTHDPGDVPYFDRNEVEEERTAGIVRLRNRIQGRAFNGARRDVLDVELAYKHYWDDVAPYGEVGPGAVEGILRGQPLPGIYLAGEADWDIGRDGFDTAYVGVGLRPWKEAALFTGYRYVRDESETPTLDLSWRWSEKYGLRFREAYDFRRDENTLRLLFRRHSEDHTIVFGVVLREDDASIRLAFYPSLGGPGTVDRRTLNDEPDLDPWGVFP